MRFNHWGDVPQDWDSWPLQYFKPKEIACRGTGQLYVNIPALTKLDMLRRQWNKPLRLNSAFRSDYHNCKVGGSPMSCHTVRGGASAFDIALGSYDKSELIGLAKRIGFTGLGVNYRTFLHVDCGRARSW